ncbi:ribbon-helix-helix protein [Ancylobacter aquaticus]|uniref:Ribbon-helix-helix protein n=1 Tax=Ancylobacter aquaticus TaxID=100 RepID=A0A4R1I1D6_ANCAQ|nr:ribbon-helix-helix domain-containing protein [Ancylobacter aquaticus]TCK28997.1 ribbon-helix-helix protein [Ancylobacter aquaticus]
MAESAKSVPKRSVITNGQKTSVSLEDEFWSSLKDIARDRGQSIAELVSSIDSLRVYGSLSSALRLFVLQHYRHNPGS